MKRGKNLVLASGLAAIVIGVIGAIAACVGADPVAGEAANPEASTPTPEGSTTTEAGADTGACTDTSCDPKNCGAAGHDCLGGACAKGHCQALLIAKDQLHPGSIVGDGDNVYWVNAGSQYPCSTTAMGDGALMTAKVDGTLVKALVSGAKCASTVVVTGPDIIFSTAGTATMSGKDGAIQKLPKTGGAVTDIYAATTSPTQLQTDGTLLFWFSAKDGVVRSGSIAGAPVVNVAAGVAANQNFGIALDTANLFWSAGAGQNGVWTASKTFSLDGGVDAGSPHQVAGNEMFPVGVSISTDGSTLYWAQNKGGFVRKMTISTLAVANVAASPLGAEDLVVDETHAYWWAVPSTGPGVLWRIKLDGSGVAESLYTEDTVATLGIDAKSVFVSSRTTGKILRIAK